MNVPLILEAPQRVGDRLGGYVVRWAVLGRIFATMQGGSGRIGQAEVGPESVVGWKITVRGAPEGDPRRPAPGQRFRMGARLFPIDAVAEADPSGRWLVCTAREERQA